MDRCPLEAAAAAAAAATGSAAASSVSGHVNGDDLDEDDEGFGCDIGTLGNFKKANVRSNSCLLFYGFWHAMKFASHIRLETRS